jgi:hypothetical protein
MPWWMDTVCGEKNWDVHLTFDEGGVLKGLFVYYLKKKWGLTSIIMPPLTSYSGIWINYLEGMTAYRKNKWENEIIQTLTAQLPRFTFLGLRCYHSLTNWLPFYWYGFNQTVHYTYRIENLNNANESYQNLRGNIRWYIRKAKKKELRIESGSHLFQQFYAIYKLSSEKNKLQYYSFKYLSKIHEAIQKNSSGNIFIATNHEGNVHAGAYILWDKHTAYYWLGASNPALRQSGAVSFLLWEVILSVIEKVKNFDFDGSMEPGVEQFFAAFGTTQKPCFVLSKTNNLMIELLLAIKNRRKKNAIHKSFLANKTSL